MKGIRIENLVIFPEKKQFFIFRGGRTRVLMIDQGRVMIRLKGYENYYLCVKTCEVYSPRGKSGVLKPLKKIVRSGKTYYHLSISGHDRMVSLESILEQNLKEVEKFFLDNKKILSTFQVRGNSVSH